MAAGGAAGRAASGFGLGEGRRADLLGRLVDAELDAGAVFELDLFALLGGRLEAPGAEGGQGGGVERRREALAPPADS